MLLTEKIPIFFCILSLLFLMKGHAICDYIIILAGLTNYIIYSIYVFYHINNFPEIDTKNYIYKKKISNFHSTIPWGNH